jgi:ribosome-binding factor A
MSSVWEVRRLTAADAELMQDIVATLPVPKWRDERLPGLRHLESAPADRGVFVFAAFEGKRPAGFVTGYRFPSLTKECDLVYIYDVYVVPNDRRRGIGRKLMDRVLAECRRGGVAEGWVGATRSISSSNSTCAEPRRGELSMAKSNSAKAPSQRQLKVGELIRHALADIFSRGDIMDEVLARNSLTVPEVRMTPDLKLATAYVITLGGGEASEAVEHLNKHKRFLRGEVAKRVSVKFMPEIRFKVDTSFEASARIDELLASPDVARDLED